MSKRHLTRLQTDTADWTCGPPSDESRLPFYEIDKNSRFSEKPRNRDRSKQQVAVTSRGKSVPGLFRAITQMLLDAVMTETHLSREEYIEQAYFFRAYRERLEQNVPSQEILATIGDEVLATTRLPMALDFLRGELLLTGRVSDGMKRLPHYFRPFQMFVLSQAEDDRSRFDQKIALLVLEREAEYLAGSVTPAGLFIYQFECIARNRLGYDTGLVVMAEDPVYDPDWRDWILKTRMSLGTRDFAERIYDRSEHFVQQYRRQTGQLDFQPAACCLFDRQEGRIAWANRGKDPLFLFAALQRQLGYPAVPRARPTPKTPMLHPAIEQRLQRLEQRIQLLESEVKGEFDLSDFYAKPSDLPNFDDNGPTEV